MSDDVMSTSIKKVHDYLLEQENMVTPTSIKKRLRMSYDTVVKSLEFMDSLHLLDVENDGRIWFVRIARHHKERVRQYQQVQSAQDASEGGVAYYEQ